MRGDFSVIYAQGTRKAFSFLDQVTRPNRPVKCGDTGELPSCGFATWQEYALAHGQMRHQFGVVLDILGEQSRIISRECRQPKGITAMFTEYATAPAGTVHAVLDAIGMVRASPA